MTTSSLAQKMYHRDALIPAGCSACKRAMTLSATLCLVAAMVGCSDGRPARVPVSGKVVIDGEPVTQGVVQFVAEGVRPASGKLDQQGRFTLSCYDDGDGIVPGNYKVMVAAKEVISESKVRWLAPRKYADYSQSGLTFDINEPIDDLKIELTWDGQKPPQS